jgi:hypothetical protein
LINLRDLVLSLQRPEVFCQAYLAFYVGAVQGKVGLLLGLVPVELWFSYRSAASGKVEFLVTEILPCSEAWHGVFYLCFTSHYCGVKASSAMSILRDSGKTLLKSCAFPPASEPIDSSRDCLYFSASGAVFP